MQHVRTLVLGAGPTGLGAAWRLHERGDTDWLMVERQDRAGGAATSVTDGHGFTWDLGGHVIHSHYPYFDQVLAECVQEWTYPVRNGAVWMNGSMVPQPVQQHLSSLPATIAQRVMTELRTPVDYDAGDLHTWFLQTFGPTLTKAFFEPFNTKMWAHPPRLLTHEWTSLRSGSDESNVPLPRLTPLAPRPVTPFPYPAHGSGSMWSDIAGRLPPSHQQYLNGMVSIDLNGRSVCLDDGTEVTYDNLVSTIPLNHMLRQLGDDSTADLLLHSSVAVVGLGYNGTPPPLLADKSWVYQPDPSVPFHRATVLSNYSPIMAGPGRWSLLLETGTSPHRPIDRDSLLEECRGALKQWGVHDNPVSVWQRFVPLGYPVPFVGRDAILRRTLSTLEANNVYSRGRFGGWRYESCNQDYSFMQGVQAVDHCLDGQPENIFWPGR